MTPAAAAKACELHIERCRAACLQNLERAAQEVLNRNPKYTAFEDVQGSTGFRSTTSSVYFHNYEDLTKEARAVVDLAEDLASHFGSSGLTLEPSEIILKMRDAARA